MTVLAQWNLFSIRLMDHLKSLMKLIHFALTAPSTGPEWIRHHDYFILLSLEVVI